MPLHIKIPSVPLINSAAATTNNSSSSSLLILLIPGLLMLQSSSAVAAPTFTNTVLIRLSRRMLPRCPCFGVLQFYFSQFTQARRCRGHIRPGLISHLFLTVNLFAFRFGWRQQFCVLRIFF